jgi:hypothetical protein
VGKVSLNLVGERYTDFLSFLPVFRYHGFSGPIYRLEVAASD